MSDALMNQPANGDQAATLIEVLLANAESQRQLAHSMSILGGAIHALADAIASPVEEEPEAPKSQRRYMDGTPIGG